MAEHFAYWMAVSVNFVFVMRKPRSTGQVFRFFRVALPDVVEARLHVERYLHVGLVVRVVVVLQFRRKVLAVLSRIHVHLMRHAFSGNDLAPLHVPAFSTEEFGDEVFKRVPGGAELEQGAAEGL